MGHVPTVGWQPGPASWNPGDSRLRPELPCSSHQYMIVLTVFALLSALSNQLTGVIAMYYTEKNDRRRCPEVVRALLATPAQTFESKGLREMSALEIRANLDTRTGR